MKKQSDLVSIYLKWGEDKGLLMDIHKVFTKHDISSIREIMQEYPHLYKLYDILKEMRNEEVAE
jgi:hypothetical protein